MTDIDVSSGSQFPAWVLFVSALVLTGTAVVFYARVAGSIRRRAFALLVALRLLAVLLLLLLFFEPVLSYQRRYVERASVALLVDTSKSMRLSDPPSPARLARVKEELTGPGGLVASLSRDFDVHVWRFDSSATALESPDGLAALEPDGEATNLSKAVRTVLAAENLRDLAGVVLFTDGIHNAAGDPVAEL
ncbi:MAG TPA: vWA domain-containing protein, partial [Planctomycetota bacterium]|nr:vWA domain-containing protein [Planctomycetota bacterium]